MTALRARLLATLGAELLLVCAGLGVYASLRGDLTAGQTLGRIVVPAVAISGLLLAGFGWALGPVLLRPLR
ncbi:MAG: hypothetical protein HY900_06740, partial [Deltaproteobacteria bacterium]|nr:hypothetical protein [Deltaproteobacteria bacterium]